MKGLSTSHVPQVSQNMTKLLQMSTVFWPSGGQSGAKLASYFGADRWDAAASAPFQDPQPSTIGMWWKWKGWVTVKNLMCHNRRQHPCKWWQFLSIWKPIWRQAGVRFWSWKVRCSCIDTISRPTTLGHMLVKEMKGLSTRQVPQVSQH